MKCAIYKFLCIKRFSDIYSHTNCASFHACCSAIRILVEYQNIMQYIIYNNYAYRHW